MQFKKEQREQLAATWKPSSWFFDALGTPARGIIERAYGLQRASTQQKAKAQEDVSLALGVFARKVGCSKGQAIHALLTGSFESLQRAVKGQINQYLSHLEARDKLEESFRDINTGDI